MDDVVVVVLAVRWTSEHITIGRFFFFVRLAERFGDKKRNDSWSSN
jgi:hypothetical protein